MEQAQQQQQITQNIEQEIIEDFQDLHPQDQNGVGKTFRLIKKLDSGAFGEVYHAINLENSVDVAVKLELSNTKQPMLFYEAKLYQYLHKEKELSGAEAQWAQRKQKFEKGIPKVFYCSNEGEYNVLIMELLGPNLEDLFNICNKKFQLKTVCMIAISAIQRIQFLHSKGFVHRDIKPQNFCIGLGPQKEIIYMIDLAFAKKYISNTGKHIPFTNDKSGITGTLRFASINNHKGYEHSRRDDLESLIYMLIYFIKGSLPWMNLKYNNKKEKFERVYDKKQYMQADALCKGTQTIIQLKKGLPEEFTKLLQQIQHLQFEEKPNYQGYIQLFQELLQKNGLKDDKFYDWRQVAQNISE